MKQDIRFKGLHLSPDEQSIDNGALAICDGMEMRDGALRPCVIEGTTKTTVDGEILYIHEVKSGNKNAIFIKDNKLYSQELEIDAEPIELNYTTTSSTGSSKISLFGGLNVKTSTKEGIVVSDILNVTSNGNTLVVMTQSGLRYFRWQNQAYTYLGEMPPEIQIEFDLQMDDHLLYHITNRSEAKSYEDNCPDKLKIHHKIDIMSWILREEVSDTINYKERNTLVTREDACDAALGKVNTAIAEINQFFKPFYVRYCYRLWDGRKIMHSAPIFMFTELNYPETVCVFHNEGSIWAHCAQVYPAKLQYKCSNPAVLETLKDQWEDIVKSIDIYITPGISRYDESAYSRIITIYDTEDSSDQYPEEAKWHRQTGVSINGYGTDIPDVSRLCYPPLDNYVGTYDRIYQSISPDTKDYMMWFYTPIMDKFGDIGTDFYDDMGIRGLKSDVYSSHAEATKYNAFGCGIFTPQPLSDDAWRKRLLEQSSYYLLKRFELDEDTISSTMVDLPIDSGVVSNLEAQAQMITSTSPDDYRSHHGIIATSSYTYNNRINLSGISDLLYKGFALNDMVFPSSTAMKSYAGNSTSLAYQKEFYALQNTTTGISGNDEVVTIDVAVVGLQEEGVKRYVARSFSKATYNILHLATTMLFYPDTRAKEIWLCEMSGNILNPTITPKVYFKLTEHPLLNGAYHFGTMGGRDQQKYQVKDLPDGWKDTGNVFDETSYIYTSASGNPFVFPAANRYSVGMGKVLAIASTTKALSQGQFGQYPLMAFTTDGIWALEVSSTGSYSSIQPISREVISNADGLLQLDQSIAFVTKRAVNQIMSSDVISISDALQGPLRDLSTMLENLPATAEIGDLIKAVQQSEGLYDFVNSRLLYFLKDDDGAFTGDVLILCTHDTAWCFKSLGSDVIKGIYNSYPYPYIHYNTGELNQLADPYDNANAGANSGLVVTRTIKANALRSAIRGFVQDYDFEIDQDDEATPVEKRPMIMFWGSNDNRRWHYIGKSNAREMGCLPGRIYKYFRLAVKFENVRRNDLYHGVQLDIAERFNRR